MAVYPKVIKIQLLGKGTIYRFLLVAVLFFLAGCTTEKNTVMSRAYHNLTAHYNVYFNGKESLQTGVQKINNSVEDDYSKVLPLYKSSHPSTANAATGDMENAIMKGSKLIQSHSITKKPKRRKKRTPSYIRFASQEEFNNWVDDAYVLMGKAYFFKKNYGLAIENLNYVLRKFPDDHSKYTASIWLIRCYTEMERYVEAYELIQLMQTDEKFPRRLEGELAAATADYYAKQLYYLEGIPFLSLAVKNSGKKEDRLRYKYVLAQWYQETGNTEKASETFREVTRMNPPYKMAFNAHINAAGTFTGSGDVEKLKKELRKMLRDKKNLEFRDQIYFAMGNISLKEGNSKLAKEQYIKSASMSVENLYQRALSCLTLAQIYFDELEYKRAQSYYDSAMVVIDDQYPNYKQISDRHKSLTRLTDNIYTVEREDSLQRIAAMDESSRNALIDRWISLAAEKEEKAKLAESTQMMDRNYFRQNENRFGLSQQQQGAGWYFYSPTTVAYGKVEFERLWGKRKLEDGWRRANKSSYGDEQNQADGDSLLTAKDNGPKIKDPKNREFYTQNLPVNDSLLAVSHSRIRSALFNAGRIFKTDFNDFVRSVESYEELNKRYPDNLFSLSSWFELWDLYSKQKNTEKAEYYKNLITSRYPDSKYAKYLINPNYFIELEAREDSVNRMYQQMYQEFKKGEYAQAGLLSDQILKLSPDSVMLPKVKFFRTVADGTASNRETFSRLLTDYISTYPEAEPKPLAERILKLIQDSTLVDYQKLVASGYLNDQIKNSELLPGNERGEDEFGGKFSYEEDLLHYFVIAYPKNADLDLNRLKFDLANYNIDHFTRFDFDMETLSLNANTNLLVVRSLSNKEQGLIYFRSIIRKRDVFAALNDIKYVNFITSSTNYRAIAAEKDITDYLKFFIKNYSHFISGDFSDELLPDPEDLLAKAKAEENLLQEKGSFVTVAPTGDGLDIFSADVTGVQNFVIAVNATEVGMKQVVAAFNTYNRDENRVSNLSVRQTAIADYQLMIVSSFKNKAEAMAYFTKTLANRKLFRSLDTLSYRTFVVTDANLRKLQETKKIAEYQNYFKIKYIDGAPVATPQQTTSNTSYSGPYKQQIEGSQSYVLIVPKEEVNEEKLTDSIRKFNTKHYQGQNLPVSSEMLDDFRLIVKVSGLNGKQAGLDYLRAIAADQQVYGPLENANYRNFVMTPENEIIFRQNKNILTYMEFYKQFYLK